MGKFIDLTGQIFGKLTVIKQYDDRIRKQRAWICKCNCGNSKEIIVTSGDLKSGNTKSCGCTRKENLIKFIKTHGMKGTSIYTSWQHMKSRCNNKNNKNYLLYGGRGITYDENWENFENFYKDMGDTWFEKATLDRIDCDGNYCKENCRWITIQEQQNNKRVNVLVTIYGETLNLSQVSKKYNIHYQTIVNRYNNGLRDEKLISLINKSNKQSKVKGVTWDKKMKKWVTRINTKTIHKHLGSFLNEDDAIKARLEIEKKYFGNNAPQRYLFEQYGISV
jgi:predicted small secreted protein/transposase